MTIWTLRNVSGTRCGTCRTRMLQLMHTDYDAIVVGAGQARLPLANRPSASGMKVALVERGLVGGTCVNTGCTPMTRVARAVEKAETRGFMRFLIDAETDKILGAAISNRRR